MKLRTLANILLSLAVMALFGCAQQTDIPQSPLADNLDVQLGPQSGAGQLYKNSDWQELWEELSARLQHDGFSPQKTKVLFQSLDIPPSLTPMGMKVRELYTSKYLSQPPKRLPQKEEKKKSKRNSLGIPGPWFKDIVNNANARRCLNFIKQHQTAFIDAENRYGVPREIAAALLFVETRLGTYTGKNNAFYALASMSVIRTPDAIPYHLRVLPKSYLHTDWIHARMQEKSEWAYRELKALLTYCEENGIDPLSVKGSMYGAIGMCQFMPSNLPHYAADGDHDGRIDIFQAPDAIASLSRYLARHGWEEVMTLNERVKVLLKYNNMRKYAYTILALAKTMERLEGKRPTIQTKKPSPRKKVWKKR